MMTETAHKIAFVEQGVVFIPNSQHYDSYSLYHAGKNQTIIIRYSSEMSHFSAVVLPGHLNFNQFRNQYLQLSADTFSTNAFPSEEAALEFSKLLLAPEHY